MTFFLKGHFTCFKTIVNRFQPTGLSRFFLYLYVFFDETLLPVFYANREPFGKMLTLIDFAYEKKKKENYYCYWRSICQIMIRIKNFYQ